MKKNTHPPYQEVLFVDSSTGVTYVIGSTLQTKEREKLDGKEYPVSRVPISSSSHPFFTKANQHIDAEGIIDKFKNKYLRKSQEVQKSQEAREEAKKASVKTAKKAKK